MREAERVSWAGKHRPALENQGVYPRPFQALIPVWIAVGGTPQSAERAATLGLPMALAIIGGQSEQFAPMVELYRDAGQRAGHDPTQLSLSINTHGYIADDARQAVDESFPSFQLVMNRIGLNELSRHLPGSSGQSIC